MLTNLIPRAALVVAAVAGVLLDAPVPVTSALSLAAMAAVAQRLATRRGQGGVDALLVAAGALLCVLAVSGLLLDLANVPLRPDTWAVALGIGGLAALAVDALVRPASGALPSSRGRPAPGDTPASADPPAFGPGRARAQLIPMALWGVATAAVVLLALSVAVRSSAAVDVAPVQVSLARVTGTTAQVVVSTDTRTGPLEVRSATGGSTLSYPLFRLEPGSSRTTDVLLPQKGRTVITVSNAGQSQPLRTLVVDR